MKSKGDFMGGLVFPTRLVHLPEPCRVAPSLLGSWSPSRPGQEISAEHMKPSHGTTCVAFESVPLFGLDLGEAKAEPITYVCREPPLF